MNILFRLLLILLPLVPLAATADIAENFSVMRLFDNPRIVSHHYSAFCLDRQGYLWIGSGLGLVKFDGSDFEEFKRENDVAGSISSNIVIDILCDSKGRIWVGTADGLNLYDRKTNSFKTVELPDISFHGYILDLTECPDGSITFIVAGIGIFKVDTTGETELKAERIEYIPERNSINTIVSTNDGGFVCGTHFGHIVRINPDETTTSTHVTPDFFKGVLPTGNNNIIAFTSNEIWRVSVSTMKITQVDTTPLEGLTINDICTGADNIIYIATSGGGVWRMETYENRPEPMHGLFHPSVDIDHAKLETIYMDIDSNLWLGCINHGVLMLPSTPMPFTFHPLKSIIKNYDDGISAMLTTPSGIWMALESNDIVHLSDNHKLHNRIHIPAGRGICALHQTDDGTIYAASTGDAIYRINQPTGTASRLIDLDYKSIRYSIAGGGSIPYLYIGIHGYGILRHDLTTDENTMFSSKELGEEKLLNDWIASSYIDSRQRLWIGLYSGLACYDIPADTFKTIQQAPFFSLGACNDIKESRNGLLLIGTSCGLVTYDPDKDVVEKITTTTDGLCDNDVRAIEIDNDDIAWIGTMRGLSRYSTETGKISSLQGGHGLSETTFLYSDFNDKKQQMYFAGNLGYTTFSPETIPPVTFTRPVKVSGVYLNGHRLTEAHTLEGHQAIESDSNYTYQRVNISYNDNNLMIRLSTMDFRDPANVNYEWKFADSDNSWISTKPGSGTIVIPGLDPGNHTLLVRATDNAVHSDYTRLIIHVTPPWYLSAPAKIIYAFILIGIMILVYILFKKNKSEEIYEAKVKFFMDISHEIRSPVTCIMSPLETLLSKEHDPETTAMLSGMHRNAGRILSLANQLLEIRKIDKGKKQLIMQPTDLVDFASELVEIYRPMADSKSIDITLDNGDGVKNVWIDRDNFDKVLVNLITNAIKYTPEGGSVKIILDTTNDSIMGECARIRVIDTGIGIDPKHINRIFERFYQGQRSKGGFGVGLNLARQLVRLHHGTLTAANRTDSIKGSIFTVMIPLGCNHLTPEETTRTPQFIDAANSSYASTTQNTRKNTGGNTILIVDDDRELREYLVFHFSHNNNVLEASDGAEALQILHDNNVDVVISDVVMPGMDGLALLKAIKSNTMTTHTPVILLSSRNDIANRMQGWEYGADGYIGKPFTIQELESIVDNLIRNRLRIKGKFTGAQDNCNIEPDPSMMGNDEALLEKITQVIESRVDDSKFNVETLGIEVGISRAHLHRKMKGLIGMSPSDFIRNIRLRRACEILTHHDVDITQVAYKVGFTSQPHFSTAFKKFTGLTPTEYRQRNSQPVK